MQQFNMPVMRLVYEPFNMKLLEESFDVDMSYYLGLLYIKDIRIDTNGENLIIEFIYGGVQGEVSFSTVVDTCNGLDPEDIHWRRKASQWSNHILEALTDIMFAIADEIFRINGYYEES